MKKLLSLAGLVLAVSSLCYATEVQQNRVQVSGAYEYAAFDVGLQQPVVNFQSVNVPVNQFVSYPVGQFTETFKQADTEFEKSGLFDAIKLHIHKELIVIQKTFSYGNMEILSHTLHSNAVNETSYKFEHKKVA